MAQDSVLASESSGAVIKETVTQAINYSPEVQASWHEFLASQQDIKVAKAGYLPSVDLSASAGSRKRDFDGRDAYTANQGQISLTQSLFNGFKTSGQVEHFDNASLVRYFELLDIVENTALEAVRAYQDVVSNRELVRLARENYAKHREVYSQIEERVMSGVGRRVDLEQVAGRLALAETNLLTEASNLHDVSARYLRIVGLLPPETLPTTTLVEQDLPADIREALILAYKGNPGFHAAVKNIAAAKAQVKVERSGYYPKAELRARQTTSRNLNGFDNRVDPSNYGDESAVELAVTYNLFAGGANRAAVRRSLEDVNQAKDLRDKACIDLRQTTQIAYNDAHRIKEQLTSLDQHRRASDKVRTAYTEQFNIGQRTLLDLLDAENEYFEASRSYTKAQADLEIAHARSLAAMGSLLPAVGVVRDGIGILHDAKIDKEDLTITESACPDIAPEALGREALISELTPLSADALFDTNSSKLKPSSISKLDALVANIKATDKVVAIDLVGHTDSTGSDAINIPLSKARAQSVRDYMVLNGLETIPMTVEGKGATSPVADNTTEAGKMANRRVDVIVSRRK
ncbi:MAG: TolC family outer membrane protein [Cellvibrio sp.]|nr:TolC family outer membrane protein [Cellvibrio sp.]